MNLYHQNNSYLCIHIESTTLADGTYKLVPESESEQCEAQVNLTEGVEDPSQSLEEPKASFTQEGKPQSMIFIFETMQCFTSIYLCI